MIYLTDEQLELIKQDKTTVLALNTYGEAFVGKHETILVLSDSHKAFIHVLGIVRTTIYECVDEGLATLEQLESWIGEIKERREEDLRERDVTLVQFERMRASYKEIVGVGFAQNIDLAYAFLKPGEYDDS